MGQAFDKSCISKYVHEIEIEKFETVAKTIDFSQHFKGKTKRSKTISLNMEGCCRHFNATKDIFDDFRVIAIDCSQPMLDYGHKVYNIPEKDLFCTKIQDFPFQTFEC